MATVSLIFGILSCLLGFIPGFSALLFSVPGIILGVIALKKSTETPEASGLPIAGIVLNIIGTVIAFSVFFCIRACINQFPATFG